MSDTVVDILTNLAIRLIDSHDSAPATGYSYDPSAMIIDDTAKLIRQQIGRELLSKADLYGDKEGVYTAVKALDIREVCQMEES